MAASKATTCGQPARVAASVCSTPDTGGYDSTVVYVCDGCGKTRRGQPHATGPDGE